MNTSDLLVPDRFDTLQRKASTQLQGIIEPIDSALRRIQELQTDMKAAGRGGFLILRGESGSGKSTFLNTLGLFMEGIEVVSISRQDSIAQFIQRLPVTSSKLRVCVVEGRDALREVKTDELEAAIHDINAFIRTPEGERTAVIWPVNADDILNAVVDIARRVGADSLLGVGDPAFRFVGPDKRRFIEIANKTIAVLNNGAGLFDLGVSRNRADEILAGADTIGRFLGQVRQELLINTRAVQELLQKERCRLWVVVIAGNEPEGEVDALTRGIFSFADIERLMDATQANVVSDLKNYPEKLGILGTVLDARILHLPILTALSIARHHHDSKLLAEMKVRGLSTSGTDDSIDRIKGSGLGKALNGDAMGLKTPGGKIGSNTEVAFEKLVDIATSKDGLVNSAVGEALVASKLVETYETEKNLGTGLKRLTDIYCMREGQPIRIEMMWRSRTSRAEIANYVLTKLYNYGRAIGFLAPGK